MSKKHDSRDRKNIQNKDVQTKNVQSKGAQNKGAHSKAARSTIVTQSKGAHSDVFAQGAYNASISPVFQPSSYYLEHIKMTSFGKFSNTIVGAFQPHLNVVYGSNESGKTTINELVKGVLFGWPAARKGVNSYRPEGAERVGSLFFKSKTTGEVAELKRIKNTDQPNDEFHVLDDIDSETYSTMFALTSDELMQLDKHNEVTARLLTAGSGTSASPAKALEELDQRIKEKMSRAAANDRSIANLLARQTLLRENVQNGLSEADHFRAQEKRLEALSARKDALLETQTALNTEIETLKAQAARIQSLDQAIQNTNTKLQETVESSEGLQQYAPHHIDDEILMLSKLSQAEEYRLRDYLDDKEEQRAKQQHHLDNAARDALKSQTEYELLHESRDVSQERHRAKMQRRVKLIVSIIIPILMAVCGVCVLLYAQQNLRLSYLMAGIGMLMGAVMIAAVGIIMNLRPSKLEEHLDERLKKAEWIMKQDEKNLAKVKQEELHYQESLKNYLDAHHMRAAQGSLKRARSMLDEARQYRFKQEAEVQNEKALALQEASLRSALEHAQAEREEVLHKMGLAAHATSDNIKALIAQKEDERAATITLSNETHRQYGEIQQELQQARFRQNFDQDKLDLELVDACLLQEYRDLARLLIARRSLEIAINEWEKKSQPEAYRIASRLLENMTQGAWQQVRMNSEGDIEVLNALRTPCPPHLLSLGTRQQLYLSLRIALLIMSDNVGKSLPVLCDDILVHFDETRRRGAARALLELAQHRQVIVFTCHPEIVSLMQGVDSSLNFLEL